MTSPHPGDTHIAAQAALSNHVLSLLPASYDLVELDQIKASTPRLQAAINALTTIWGKASKALAITHYNQQRVAAGVRGGTISLKQIEPPPAIQIDKTVQWAVQPLYGPLNDEPVTIRGIDYAPVAERVEAYQQRLAAGVDRIVVDQGRDQIVDSTRQDRLALGYVRRTEPDPCAFCALLATRGAVYKERTFDRINALKLPHWLTESDAKTHDHCRCHMEPVFTPLPEDDKAELLLGQYEAVTKAMADKGEPINMRTVQHAWQLAYRHQLNPSVDPHPPARVAG